MPQAPIHAEEWLDQLESPDPESRRRAIEVLTRYGEVRAIPVLKRISLWDELTELRYEARKSLLTLQSRSALLSRFSSLPSDAGPEAIRVALKSPDAGLRYQAIKFIAQRGESSFLPLLLERVTREKDARCRCLLASTLGALGNRSAVAPIATFLSDPDPQVRINALVGLMNLGEPSSFQYAVRMLADPDAEVRAYVLKTMARLGRLNLLKVCSSMLRHEEVWMHEGAIFCLASVKIPEAIPLLEGALSHPEPRIRQQARAGLTTLATEGHQQAEIILQNRGPEGPPAGLESYPELATIKDRIPACRLSSEKPDDRLRAIQEIVSARDPASLPILAQRLAEETDDRVLASLIMALGKLQDANCVPILEGFLKHPVDRVRANAVESLGMIRPPGLKRLLEPMLEDPNNRARANAIVAMGLAGADVDRALTRLFESSDSIHRRSGVWAAGCLGTPVATALLARAVEDPDTSVRGKADDALQLLAMEGRGEARKVLEDRGIDVETLIYLRTAPTASVPGLMDATAVCTRRPADGRSIRVPPAAPGNDEDSGPPRRDTRPIRLPAVFGERRFLDELTRSLEEPDPDVRLSAIGNLDAMTPTAWLLPCLRATASIDPAPAVREAARGLLARWEPVQVDNGSPALPMPSSADEALRWLAQKEWSDRLQMVFFLLARPPEWLGEVIVKRMRVEGDPWVLAASCRALGEIGDTSGIQLLMTCLYHQDSRVVANALESLDQLQAPGLPQLVNLMLDNPDPRVKAVALRILARLDIERACEKIPGLALSGERSHRSSAIHLLRGIPAPRASAIALQMLEIEDQPDLFEKELDLAAESPDPGTMAQLQELQANASPERREILSRALDRLKGREGSP